MLIQDGLWQRNRARYRHIYLPRWEYFTEQLAGLCRLGYTIPVRLNHQLSARRLTRITGLAKICPGLGSAILSNATHFG